MAVYKFSLAMVLLVFYTTQQVSVCHGFQHMVGINPVTGQDSPDCLTSNNPSSPCHNLTWVFQQGHSDSTHYALSEGQHYLTQSTPPFKDLTSLAITGTGSVVTCTDSETGLAFVNVTNLTLYDITFFNCSSLRNSTNREYDPKTHFKFHLYQFYVALYFYGCSDITMTSLVATESPDATAVVMYNTIGINVIEDSRFTSNRLGSPESAEHPGGGGFYIEFTFCIPGDNSCDDFDDSIAGLNSNGEFRFRNATFKRNKASNLVAYQESDTFIIPYERIHNAFGKGGGLAIVVKGNASNNSFDVSECWFEDNEATWGGGLLVEYQDSASSNTISVRDSTFLNNGLRSAVRDTAGGGIRVGHYVYDLAHQQESTRNRVLISRCVLSGNHALNGGGVSLFPVRQIVMATDQLFEITVRNTTFTHNRAQVGAALESTVFSLFVKGQLPSVAIDACNFLNNTIHDYTDKPREVGVGVVYSNGIPMHFWNDVVFEGNDGSGLAIVGTLASFCNATATFTANRAKYGGAVTILGSAFLLINTFTSMTFERNIAEVHGGAIANVFVERQNFKNYPNCFVRHDIPFVPPQDWGAKFKFMDNSAGLLGNSIYTTSLHPCAWAGGSGQSMYDDILCWPGWEFSRNGSRADCHAETNTGSGNIRTDDDDDPPLGVYPGREFQLPLLTVDDLGTVVTNETVFTAKSLNPDVSQVNPRYVFMSGSHMRVDGVEGSSVTLQLNSNSERPWEVEINIQLLNCPPGFVPSRDGSQPPGQTSSCVCNSDNYQGLLHCSHTEVNITNGYWFGETNDTTELVTSLCLPGFCHTEVNAALKRLPNSEDELDKEICGLNNRTGILCGECVDGFGPSVNTEDYECISCNDTVVAEDVALYVLSVYLPLFLLFVFIIVFSVRLTSGPANAFIFYAQVVSSTFDLNADSHIPLNLITKHRTALLRAYRVPYGIFNLDFLENFIRPLCFGTNLSALDVLQLEYIIAFFPLLMIIAVVILVRLKDSCNCCRGRCRKPSLKFLRLWKASESLLHAFSAFLLLSYTKFSLTSSYLINVHPFYNATGHKVGEWRAYYAGQYKDTDTEYMFRYKLPACLALVLIAVLPLMLFGYPVVWFERCIIKVDFLWRWYPADKVQIFMDTFQGCYKDNRRFFAGMYFAFRLTINVCYILTDDWLQQFAVQQVACTVFIFIIALTWPYREEKWYVNYVDLFMFTNLATVNALSLYLFVYAKINPREQSLPLWPFVVQYVLVFLPLIYMVLYVAWYLLSPAQKEALMKVPKIPAKLLKKRRKKKFLQTTILGPSEGQSQSTSSKNTVMDEPTTTEITFLSDESSDDGHTTAVGSGSDDDLEAMLVRAQTQNTYKTTCTDKSSLCTPYQQWVQDAKETAKLSSRGRGQGQSAPQDWSNDLSVSVRATMSSGDGNRHDSPHTADMAELSPRHSLSNYGSIHNQAEL